MEISYLGYSSFKIVGKDISIITDPFDSNAVGLPFPKLEADVVTTSHSHSGHNNTKGVKGEFICFDSPGEYEIKNSEIIAIETSHGENLGLNTVFVYEVDGIHVCHLGDLGSELSSDQLEKIDGVDILMIPVGGKVTIDLKKVTKIISDIGPKIVIPMHFKAGKKTELGTLDDFVKEIGKTPKKVERLKIQKKDLPEELEVITF